MLRSETKWFPICIAKVRRDVTKLSTKAIIFEHAWFLLAYETLKLVAQCGSYRDVNSIMREYKNEFVEVRLQIYEQEAKVEALE